MSEQDRIRWRCRRGMLELDLILLRFLDNDYPRLSHIEQQAFEDLLECHDDTLLAMLEGKGKVQDSRFVSLIELMRSC